MMIGKRIRLWEQSRAIHVLCSKCYFLRFSTCVQTAPFYPIPVVFTVRISHCIGKKKKKKSPSWYNSKLQERKPRGIRVLSVLLGGIWISAREEPHLVTGVGEDQPLFWGAQVPVEGGGAGQLSVGCHQPEQGRELCWLKGQWSLCLPHRSTEQ